MDKKDEVVPPVAAEAAPVEQPSLDPSKLREIVGLPPESTDAELITQLAMIITAQKQHIDALSTENADAAVQNAELNETLANHFIASFSDVLPEETHSFWRGQFITNRAATIEAVVAMSAAHPAPAPAPDVAKPAPVVPAPPAPAPLKNSLADKPKSLEVLAGAPSMDAQQAAAILNRAKAIEASEKVTFTVAWDRAQAELSKPQ
jgi:hypothetical protein